MGNKFRLARRASALAVAFALTVSGITVTDVEAASKAPTLSKTKISIQKGKSKKVTVEKKKNVTVKKVTWSINKSSVAKLTKKTKTYVVIKGVKKGTATVTAKIKVEKKTYTRKLKVTVTAAQNKNTPAPDSTAKPNATVKPDTTAKPDDTVKPDATTDPSASDVPPVVTDAPPADQTETPAVTDAPDKSKAPDVTKTPSQTTAAPSTTKFPTAPPADAVQDPDPLGGTEAVRQSWNKGYISDLSALYGTKKVRISLEVREKGVENPTGEGEIQANYNGYPTLAKFDLSTEWTPVVVEYRFNVFTNNYPGMYFTGNAITDDMTMCYRYLRFEILDQGDPLGGTVLAKSSWHKGILGTPVKATHENKQVTISFKLREAGVDNPSGTVSVQSNHEDGKYPTLKSGIPLTTDWTEVSFDYTFGAITNPYPSIYLTGDDVTDEMEMFMKDFQITVTGDAPATPTPEVTAEPEATPVTHDVYIQDDSSYDSGKGGVYLKRSAAASGTYKTAYQKFGANYNLTDKTFSSVIFDVEFYNNGTKLDDSAVTTKLWATIASDSNWGSNIEKQADVGSGTTSISAGSGKSFVANVIILQWKDDAANLGYDAILIKSIKLVEAAASSGETVSDATLTGYNDLTTGAATWKFSDGTGCPAGFDISNYASVTVNFKIYDTNGDAITDATGLGGKICLNATAGDSYNGGYGDGYSTHYLGNIGQYGNPGLDGNGATSKTFTLDDTTTAADCITAQLGTGVGKIEIESIVLTAKS